MRSALPLPAGPGAEENAPDSYAACASPSNASKKASRKTLFSFCAASSASAVATSVVAGPVFFFTQRMMSSLRQWEGSKADVAQQGG